jgi:hypothetical protein
MTSRAFQFTLCALALLLFYSCSEGTFREKIEGNWKVVNFKIQNPDKLKPELVSETTKIAETVRYRFNKDFTYDIRSAADSKSSTGSWKYDQIHQPITPVPYPAARERPEITPCTPSSRGNREGASDMAKNTVPTNRPVVWKCLPARRMNRRIVQWLSKVVTQNAEIGFTYAASGPLRLMVLQGGHGDFTGQKLSPD